MMITMQEGVIVPVRRERVDDAGEFIRQQKRLDKDEGTEGFDHG